VSWPGCRALSRVRGGALMASPLADRRGIPPELRDAAAIDGACLPANGGVSTPWLLRAVSAHPDCSRRRQHALAAQGGVSTP
jgi:hypothetical protein